VLPKIRDAFTREIAKDESSLNLAYAALLISEYLTQAADITFYLAILDGMADIAQPLVQTAETDLEVIERFNRYMFGEMGFSGNFKNYYLPDNSFLNKVIDSRKGIPIALSVIYLEIGQRLGLPVWGIGMPGHFIVGYGSVTDPIYIDVFDQGRILSEDDCLAICHIPLSDRLNFRNEFLKPATKKTILFRMLLNLKQIYVEQKDWESAHKAVDFMVLIHPQEIIEIRDRGLLAYRLDRLHDALFDLKRYLFLASNGIDATWLENRVEAIEEKLNRLN